MLQSVEGFWISASVYTGAFSNSYFHFVGSPGQNVYATISLSGVDHHPGPAMEREANAYIVRWTTWGPDGALVAPFPNSMGRTQNAVAIRDCASIEFRLDVKNWVDATAQINIFQI